VVKVWKDIAISREVGAGIRHKFLLYTRKALLVSIEDPGSGVGPEPPKKPIWEASCNL
jgi:hypothetical protein